MPQAVEIVLTAHPTQINRRTLQYKHIKIAVSSFSILEWNYYTCLKLWNFKFQTLKIEKLLVFVTLHAASFGL
jgi:hypothetical protein